jgi:hypothetical protein
MMVKRELPIQRHFAAWRMGFALEVEEYSTLYWPRRPPAYQ